MIKEIISRFGKNPSLLRDFHAICDTGGRFAGSESEETARAYLYHRLKEITGFDPTRHPVNYSGWSRVDSILDQVDGVQQSFPCVALVRSPPTKPGGLIAELIDLGRGSEQDFQKNSAEIQGRIVLVQHEYMFAANTIHRRLKYQWAIDHGALGFLIACHLPETGPVTGSSGATPERGIPAAGISFEVAQALTREEPVRVRLQIKTKEMPCRTANLIVDLPGQEDEWVVLSAHIDGHHLAESAMDNATGLASVCAVAGAMAPYMTHCTRGLRIALFNLEEWALAGSAFFIEGISENERQAIKLNINLDTIAGSSHITALTSGFSKLEDWLLSQCKSHGYEIGTHRPLMANSDHYNFARHGIPAARLVAGFNQPNSAVKFLLTPRDTRNQVAPKDLTNSTILTIALVAEACLAETLELR